MGREISKNNHQASKISLSSMNQSNKKRLSGIVDLVDKYRSDKAFQQGIALVNKRQYYDAIKKFSIVLHLNPKNAEAYYKRGFCNYQLKRYEVAIVNFANAIANNKSLYNAYYWMGFAKQGLNRKDKSAIDDFKTGLALVKKHDYYNRARFILVIDGAKKALEILIAAPIKYQKQVLYNYMLSEIQKDLHQYEEAIKSITKAIKKCSKAPVNYYVKRAYCKFKTEQYDSALRDYNYAIRFRSDDSSLFTHRGEVKVYMGQYPQALDDYLIAIKLLNKELKSDASLLSNTFKKCGEISLILGNYEKANLYFKEAIKYRAILKVDKNTEVFLNAIANLYLDNDKKAIQGFKACNLKIGLAYLGYIYLKNNHEVLSDFCSEVGHKIKKSNCPRGFPLLYQLKAIYKYLISKKSSENLADFQLRLIKAEKYFTNSLTTIDKDFGHAGKIIAQIDFLLLRAIMLMEVDCDLALEACKKVLLLQKRHPLAKSIKKVCKSQRKFQKPELLRKLSAEQQKLAQLRLNKVHLKQELQKTRAENDALKTKIAEQNLKLALQCSQQQSEVESRELQRKLRQQNQPVSQFPGALVHIGQESSQFASVNFRRSSLSDNQVDQSGNQRSIDNYPLPLGVFDLALQDNEQGRSSDGQSLRPNEARICARVPSVFNLNV